MACDGSGVGWISISVSSQQRKCNQPTGVSYLVSTAGRAGRRGEGGNNEVPRQRKKHCQKDDNGLASSGLRRLGPARGKPLAAASSSHPVLDVGSHSNYSVSVKHLAKSCSSPPPDPSGAFLLHLVLHRTAASRLCGLHCIHSTSSHVIVRTASTS